jgi:hypothetical protein
MVTSVCPFRLAVASWAEVAESSVWPPDAVPAFQPSAPAWVRLAELRVLLIDVPLVLMFEESERSV